MVVGTNVGTDQPARCDRHFRQTQVPPFLSSLAKVGMVGSLRTGSKLGEVDGCWEGVIVVVLIPNTVHFPDGVGKMEKVKRALSRIKD